MMDLKIQKHDLCNIISLIGDMDLSSTFKLKDTVRSFIDEDVKNVIIDFKNLSYIDSSGIGALLRINSQFSIPGKSLWFINITGQVLEIIKLAKLHEYFPITTFNEAIENIKKNTS